jgi:uncharacterized coiled-coil protein SlyX
MTRNSIENRLAKLEQATALTPEEIESERIIRESEARVRVIDARLEVLYALRAENGKMPPPYEPEEPPPGLTDDQRAALSVARIAKIDARLAELIAIRDAP